MDCGGSSQATSGGALHSGMPRAGRQHRQARFGHRLCGRLSAAHTGGGPSHRTNAALISLTENYCIPAKKGGLPHNCGKLKLPLALSTDAVAGDETSIPSSVSFASRSTLPPITIHHANTRQLHGPVADGLRNQTSATLRCAFASGGLKGLHAVISATTGGRVRAALRGHDRR